LGIREVRDESTDFVGLATDETDKTRMQEAWIDKEARIGGKQERKRTKG
jgi:hypothetical protein